MFALAPADYEVRSHNEPICAWRAVAGPDVTVYTFGAKHNCACQRRYSWQGGPSWRGCKSCQWAGGTTYPASSESARRVLRSSFESAMGRTLDVVSAALRTNDRGTAYAAWSLVMAMRHHIRGLGLRMSEGRMHHLLNVRRMMVDAWLLTGPRSWWRVGIA